MARRVEISRACGCAKRCLSHTHRSLQAPVVIDEYTRECLTLWVKRRFTHKDVLEMLTGLFIDRGVPVHIRSDNGTEFTAKKVRQYLARLSVKTLFIKPGSPSGRMAILNPSYVRRLSQDSRRCHPAGIE